MEQVVASKHSFLWAAGGWSKRLTQQFPEIFWHRVGSDRAELLAVIGHQGTVRGSTEGVRLLQYRVEHRGGIAGRGIDDLEDLCGRSLLFQCLADLGNEPRVLHRDHRLRRKVLQ